MKLMVMIFILFSESLFAQIIEMDSIYLNYKNYSENSRHPMIQALNNQEMDNSLSLHWDVNLVKHAYWRNQVAGLVTKTKGQNHPNQFSTVGWRFSIGVNITGFLSAEYYHHSQHWLDEERPMPFPVEDAVSLNLILYKKDYKPGLLGF